MSRRQKFYGHGKLLLSGEYFVLDGALALALPTTVGQSLEVLYRPSYSPRLAWKSYDCKGDLWFESSFELWHFDILETQDKEKALFVQNILRQARKQNSHFLREEAHIEAKSHLEFPLDWGLGTSSTLIYNMAQWAYVGPFELQFKTLGGSGYDIACAQSDRPIFYRKRGDVPEWATIPFDPLFKNELYFVHLGRKQLTAHSITYYKEKTMQKHLSSHVIDQISKLTEEMAKASDVKEFEEMMVEHENIVGDFLDLPQIRSLLFQDYWGGIKSLGAWGGDFIMVTSDRGPRETRSYFYQKGFDICLPYCELIKKITE